MIRARKRWRYMGRGDETWDRRRNFLFYVLAIPKNNSLCFASSLSPEFTPCFLDYECKPPPLPLEVLLLQMPTL
jgi:hypothetical protein